MRSINLQDWPRRKHFEMFKGFDYPHFNLCAPMDITRFQRWLKQRPVPFTTALAYLLTKAANAAVEFRWRIRGGEVVEHEVVHPSLTVLTADDLFGFCTLTYGPDFDAYVAQANPVMAEAKAQLNLDDEGRDDVLYMTSIPWVAFTSLLHPLHLSPPDSMPRIAWGKFSAQGKRWQMPLSVQAHHALMDGVHLGRYFERVQALLDEPEGLLA